MYWRADLLPESFAATRFENYWQDGKPLVDRIEIINIPEAASKLEALLTGDVQLIADSHAAAGKLIPERAKVRDIVMVDDRRGRGVSGPERYYLPDHRVLWPGRETFRPTGCVGS